MKIEFIKPFSREIMKIITTPVHGGKRQKIEITEIIKLTLLFWNCYYTKVRTISKHEHIKRLKQAGLYKGKNKHRKPPVFDNKYRLIDNPLQDTLKINHSRDIYDLYYSWQQWLQK